MAINCNTREYLENKVVDILKKAGFNVEKINTNSFRDLEDSLSLDHYKMTGSNNERVGYLQLSQISNKELEEKI